MDTNNSAKIKFQVETRRILEILSSEIYDSPYALLRENIQNAYDAILMRKALQQDEWDINEAIISVTISNSEIVIIDNGIGMNEDVLRNNYWKAGSSGKKTDLANKAGVIGTFGIGAMANFGICTRLQVETRAVGSGHTLISSVDREQVSLSEECIDLEVIEDERAPGTRIIATLEQGKPLNLSQAIQYLESYVKYIPVRIIVNGQCISQKDYRSELVRNYESLIRCNKQTIASGYYYCDIQVLFDASGNSVVELTNVKVNNTSITGEVFLVQGAGFMMGLRSYFGLAPVPIGQYYRLGGIVNLSMLQPTAGREALSRDSIAHINQLIILAEKAISENIAMMELADRNTQFINYIASHNRLDLAQNITIQVEPGDIRTNLGQIETCYKGRNIFYYTGTDKSIIQMYGSGENILLLVSQSNPRRQLQLNYLTNKLKVQAVSDDVKVLKTYSKSDISYEEAAFIIRLSIVLNDDYMLNNTEISYADISHGIPYIVQNQNGIINIHLARNSSTIMPVLECYKTAREVFDGFVKDFVRVHLYPRLSSYVPSSTREGADALQKLLLKNRELYKYEVDDFGKLELLMSEYIAGDTPFSEVLKNSKAINNSQAVSVNRDQIGSVEHEIPDILSSPVSPSFTTGDSPNNQEYMPIPAIKRLEAITKMKILTVDGQHSQLNGFNMFLALSDKLFNREGDFFLAPHTSKVIWGSHRVVYIFTHASSLLTLYYDIELREPIIETTAGGSTFPSTTIITKNRIFIPIPQQLVSSFRISEGSKEFYVRYDIITG